MRWMNFLRVAHIRNPMSAKNLVYFPSGFPCLDPRWRIPAPFLHGSGWYRLSEHRPNRLRSHQSTTPNSVRQTQVAHPASWALSEETRWGCGPTAELRWELSGIERLDDGDGQSTPGGWGSWRGTTRSEAGLLAKDQGQKQVWILILCFSTMVLHTELSCPMLAVFPILSIFLVRGAI